MIGTSEMNKPTERVLFELGWRAYMIKCFAALLIPAGAAMVAGSFWALTSLTALDGNLEPLETRILLFAILLVSGFLMSLGLWLFLKLYVLRISQIDDRISVTTTRVLMDLTETFEPGQLGQGRRYDGKAIVGRNNSPAPFHTIAIQGRRLPLILDEQASVFDTAAIERLQHS
jgi:hypothetical protein